MIISRFFAECSKFDCNYCFSKKNILQMLREFNKKIVKTFQEWVRYFKNYYLHNVLTYVMYIHNIWALAICDGIDNFLKLLIIFIIDNSGLIWLFIYICTYLHDIPKYIMYIMISEAPDSLLKSFNDFFVFSKEFALHIIFFGEIIIIIFLRK